MKRILIVEDNKTLAKLIAKKIAQSLDYEVDIAYQLSEAKLFMKRYSYFVTLLDINLPDAPNGEIVEYSLSKDNKVIVLSGNNDKDFRAKMLKKNIIDYVNKSGVNDVNYIISMLIRLDKNQDHRVLVVDDSMVFRKTMQNMLTNLNFKVTTVAHGEEAIAMLDLHQDISLVISDYFMPVMDGLELTKEIRKTYKKSELCIIAVSSNEDDSINAMFLKQGANDYISKHFSKEEFSCRVNNSIEALENIQFITNHANRDYLTGLYNRRYFYKHMTEYEQDVHQNAESFGVAMVDIDLFKNVNDTYGHNVGDDIIIKLSEILRSNINHTDLVSRFGGEEFCIVLKNITKKEIVSVLDRIRQKVEQSTLKIDDDRYVKYTISIGVSMHSEESLDETINQADMMLYKAKQNGRNQVVFEG